MNVLIIEDEQLAADRLRRIVETNFAHHRVLEVLDTVREATAFLTKQSDHLDLIFCDIQLADGLSFEIFETVQVDVPIIFTTAYDEYSIEAFKLNSVQYLLKPLKEVEVVEAVRKYEKYFGKKNNLDIQQLKEAILGSSNEPSRFLVKTGLKMIPKKANEVALFYVENKITRLMDAPVGKSFIVDHTLEELESTLLSKDLFFRINRKQIVQKEAIDSIKPHFGQRLSLTLKVPNNFDIIVSRQKVNDFKKWFVK